MFLKKKVSYLSYSFLSFFVFLNPVVNAQSSDSLEQLPRPVINAIKIDKSPSLDGDISGDPAWNGVEPASGFTQIQPNAGDPASQKTEVYMGFTDDAVYIGVVAYDKNPENIIVSDSRRDSGLNDTDSFQLVIDGLLDRQNGFVFGTNPAGQEYDGQVIKEGGSGSSQFGSGAGAFNKEWNGSWNVFSKITDFGWTSEIEIPFTTLRYKTGDEQLWGINFQRNIRHNNEVSFWAPLSQQRKIHRVSAAGTVRGIKAPSKRNLQITPYFLGTNLSGGSLSSSDTNQEVGLDLKYSITPSLTLDATINTDFAQVEVDEQVVNLDRFSIKLPEKRPFFLENAGQFSVGNAREAELFFSRRIGITGGKQVPIDGGVRLSGKVNDKTNVGLLHMSVDGISGEAPSNKFTVARVNQEFGKRSTIGALVVDRKGDGSISGSSSTDKNQTYAIDGQWGFNDELMFSAWAARTDTPGTEDNDTGFSVKLDYDSAKWNARMNYTEIEKNFNPEVGFLSRTNYVREQYYLMRRYRPQDLYGLLEVRPHVMFMNYNDFDGFKETGFDHYDIHWEFKNGYRIDTGMNVTTQGVKEAFDIVDGVTIQPGTYDHKEAQIVFNTNRAAPLSFAVRNHIGGRFGGDRKSIEPTLRYRVGENFTSELSVKHNNYDLPVGSFVTNLTKLRLSYSFTPKMLLQALFQHNSGDDTLSTNLRFSWLQTATSGLYVIYKEFDDSSIGALPKSKEFSIKYSYMFDALK
tara:strand:+ start:4141 stop:6372 length:2232 start_codon:yes stop_codon:yes gene_type:complete